jgi:cytochrome c-type biogenesis protein CcmF
VNEALGRTGILLALLASLAGIATVLVGLKTKRGSLVASGRTYLLLVLLGAVVATVGMERALITHDFRLSYVADNNSLQTPLLYSITGLWSALQGSLLFWGLVLGAFGAAVAIRFRRRAADPVLGWATVVILGVSAFFFALMTGPADPFLPVKGAVPSDGLGPNPLLQQYPLVAFHPPLLYFGFVGLTVPFAFAVGALVTGRVGEGWLAETRRWTREDRREIKKKGEN